MPSNQFLLDIPAGADKIGHYLQIFVPRCLKKAPSDGLKYKKVFECVIMLLVHNTCFNVFKYHIAPGNFWSKVKAHS